jgi:hypothetical protein
MPTEISGSTGVNKIQDNTIVNADINSSAAIAGSKINGSFGKVLQVVTGTTSTAVQTGGSTYADTGLSATITPSATSSKVLIFVGQPMDVSTDTGSAREFYFNIVRGSTQLVQGSVTQDAVDANRLRVGVGHFLNHLDSPNTTSATTYKTQFKVSAGASDIYAQGNSTASTITLMEIAG